MSNSRRSTFGIRSQEYQLLQDDRRLGSRKTTITMIWFVVMMITPVCVIMGPLASRNCYVECVSHAGTTMFCFGLAFTLLSAATMFDAQLKFQQKWGEKVSWFKTRHCLAALALTTSVGIVLAVALLALVAKFYLFV